MVITNFPPYVVRVGYRQGSFFLELSDGSVEKFDTVWARVKRETEIQRDYNAAVMAEAEKRS